jgi:hypothetical protein
MNLFIGILSSLQKKIDRFRCVMKCGPVRENKALDILDEEVGM